MKIQHSFERASGLLEANNKEQKKVRDTRGVPFQTHYRTKQEETVRERVDKLLDEINKQGEKLGSKVNVRELKLYKLLISELLQEMVNNSHIFFKENVLDRRGRHRVWATVKKVNIELETLTQEILNEEKDNLKILKCMEDIRGMILDIVM